MISYSFSDFSLERVDIHNLEHRFGIYKLENDPSVQTQLFLSMDQEMFLDCKEFGSGSYFARMFDNLVFYLEIGPISRENSVSLSYATFFCYRHKGFASHILEEVMKVLFLELQLEKITTIISPSNFDSKDMVEKLGFQRKEDTEVIFSLERIDYLKNRETEFDRKK